MHSGTKLKNKSAIISHAYIMPGFIGVMIFYIIPFGIVIYYSLIDNPVRHNFAGADNYTALSRNAAFRQAAGNTAIFSAVSVPLVIAISLALAAVLERNIIGKSIILTFLLSPLMIPSASVILVWQVLFHEHGTLNQITEHFNGKGIDWLSSAYGQIVIVLIFIWKNIGYNIVLFTSALIRVPHELLEAAEIEGAGSIYRFFHIKLKFLLPTVIFVFILSLINSFKIFREIYLLTGNYPYDKLYMLQHFMNNTFRNLDYQKLSAAAVIFSAVTAAVTVVLLITENFLGKDLEN